MSVEPRSRSSPSATSGHEPANLGDILERVLDRGVVIVGDIRISLLDIELLTVKLRLLIASVDTARELGIDWWEHDPFLSSRARRHVDSGQRDREVDGGPEPRQLEADEQPARWSDEDKHPVIEEDEEPQPTRRRAGGHG
jgi:hypothetical protein